MLARFYKEPLPMWTDRPLASCHGPEPRRACHLIIASLAHCSSCFGCCVALVRLQDIRVCVTSSQPQGHHAACLFYWSVQQQGLALWFRCYLPEKYFQQTQKVCSTATGRTNGLLKTVYIYILYRPNVNAKQHFVLYKE